MMWVWPDSSWCLWMWCRLEGVVVAIENKEMLLEAWHQEQQIQQEKKMKVNM